MGNAYGYCNCLVDTTPSLVWRALLYADMEGTTARVHDWWQVHTEENHFGT